MDTMMQIWPPSTTVGLPPLTREDLCERFAYPGRPESAHVRVHMITSANGTGTVDGLSAGLSSQADMLMFGTLRELADVVLVGAGTARAEGYRGARSSEALRQRRRERGQEEVPPIAVVTARADLDPDGALFSDTRVPPIVFTAAAAPRSRVTSLVDAGARVIIAGDERVEVQPMLDALTEAGLPRVLCEGGPQLFGHLVGTDAVDELCLTLAPCLVGNTDFIYSGPTTPLLPLQLMSVLTDDSSLFLYYRRHPATANTLGRPLKPSRNRNTEKRT